MWLAAIKQDRTSRRFSSPPSDIGTPMLLLDVHYIIYPKNWSYIPLSGTRRYVLSGSTIRPTNFLFYLPGLRGLPPASQARRNDSPLQGYVADAKDRPRSRDEQPSPSSLSWSAPERTQNIETTAVEAREGQLGSKTAIGQNGAGRRLGFTVHGLFPL